MVYAAGPDISRRSSFEAAGSETRDHFHGLLMNSANRVQVREKLIQMAQFYVDKTQVPDIDNPGQMRERDAHYEVSIADSYSLQTWRFLY